jgi:predicted TIM-barrel fold metal-dependent hydrolase
MKKLNIYGVLSGDPKRVAEFVDSAPNRFWPGFEFRIDAPGISPQKIRALYESKKLTVLAEIVNQYAGIEPGDPRMEPYWSLLEQLDIPAGIHIGTGPPGAIYLGNSNYRARMHSALTLEEVLVRHPKLRVYIMHAGYPMLDDLLAVLYAHPQVYVGVGVIDWLLPREEFYRYLNGIVRVGFGDRIMFGSDQMIWPGVIELAVAAIESAPFLNAEQKRDILYNNAARFLRLSKEEIVRHHDRVLVRE